jgi:S1-C subfamily serine protease
MLIAGGVGGLTFTLWRTEERTREQANAAADARRKTDEEAAAREAARSTAAAEEARTRQQAAQKQREAEARQKDAAPSHPPQKTHVPELGFSVQASSNSAWPVVVADVDKDSEADQKGLKAEDAIMTIDGRAVNEPHDVVKAVNETTNLTKQGRKVVLLYIFNLSANEKRFVALPLKVPEPPADHCGAGLPEGSPFHNFFCNPRVSELGLSVQSRSDHNGSVTITKIDQGSDAEQKGLKVGDEIISIASRDVKDALDVMKAIDEVTKKGGKAIMLYINSGGKGRYIAVKLKP